MISNSKEFSKKARTQRYEIKVSERKGYQDEMGENITWNN